MNAMVLWRQGLLKSRSSKDSFQACSTQFLNSFRCQGAPCSRLGRTSYVVCYLRKHRISRGLDGANCALRKLRFCRQLPLFSEYIERSAK